MKNKKLFVAIIVIAFIIMVPIILGFMVKVITRIWDVKTNPESVQYTCEVEVEGYEISFMLPEGYQSSNHDTFDAFYKNEDSNFGVYGYRTEEMDDYQTKQSLYKEQNEMVMAKRDNAKVLEEEEQITKDNITITKTVYSASKDGFLNYYYFYLVEFQENPDIFAWSMINASPEYARTNEKVFDAIISTAKLLPETTMSLTKEIEVEGYGMQFSLAERYKAEEHDSFDAYYSNGDSRFGVFAYDNADINREELFHQQNEKNVYLNEDVIQIGETEQYEVNQVDIIKEVYSVKKQDAELYYLCYLVEFDEDPNKFAHVMLITLPEYAKANEQYFDEMIASGHI